MANWSILKQAIVNVIKTNGNQEITGQILQNALFSIVNSVGENYTFAGVADTSTEPGSPDGHVFYIATKSGKYSNFGGIIIDKEVAIIKNTADGSWEKIDTGIVSVESLIEGGEIVVKVDVKPATETILGGINASPKTDNETVEAKIGEDNKLYVPASTSAKNLADEEDLTSKVEDSKSVLKLADKAYDASSFSGQGRVYLRKNIVLGKNILTQSMINDANTRYIIQYDYDLNGETISIPEGCTLDFQGGSISNGSITLHSTKLQGNPIIKDIIISGTCTNSVIHVGWFSEDNFNDGTYLLKSLITIAASYSIIDLDGANISISRIDTKDNITICNGTITLTTGYPNTFILSGENVVISNITFINNIANRGVITLHLAKNVLIKNCRIISANKDGNGIFCSTKADNVVIDGCIITNIGYGILYNDSIKEQGSSYRTFDGVLYNSKIGEGLFIKNCIIGTEDKTIQGDGIEINCPDYTISNIRITNVTIVKATKVSANGIGIGTAGSDNYIVENCTLNKCGHSGIHVEKCTNVVIKNNRINECNVGISFQDTSFGVIDGNYIHNSPQSVTSYSVSLGVSDIMFINNIIDGATSFPMVMYWVTNSEFINNKFVNCNASAYAIQLQSDSKNNGVTYCLFKGNRFVKGTGSLLGNISVNSYCQNNKFDSNICIGITDMVISANGIGTNNYASHISGNGKILYVGRDPNEYYMGITNQLAIDITNGAIYRNSNGQTSWTKIL